MTIINGDQEVVCSPKKYIAFLGCNRFATAVETYAALLKCRDINEFHLLVFLDRPKNDLGIEEFQSIQNFFENNSDSGSFKSFTMQIADKNLGVWRSKLDILSKSFEMGSDFTILLEDDVLLKPDALSFCSEACNYVLKAKELITVSLYSSNLVDMENISYSRAMKFVSENKDVFQEWGIRRWPFPWGLGLTKKTYNLFVAMGWNGNDQNMGQILREANGYDLFPIISRSDHIGKSKQENGIFKVVRHINFQDSDYQNRPFQITSENKIEERIEKANYFFINLKNELAISENRVKILYGDSIFLEKIKDFQDNNKFLDIDYSYIDPHWFTDIDSIKIYDVILRIASPVTVLLFNEGRIQEFILSELKNKSTNVLIDLDKKNILEALAGLT
jgi:hypothetical protein